MTMDKREELLTKAKPIRFDTEMVRAILDGRKTVTRRLVKPQPVWSSCGMRWNWKNVGWWRNGWNPIETITWENIPYHPGDILYVRETWCKGSLNYGIEQYYYKADDKIEHCRWQPSTRMPKEAARIFLKVTKVSVERLQDIDGYGILAEGVDNGNSNPTMGNRWENMQRMAFSGVWDSTVKKKDLDKYGWDANPWVWVVEFERIN